MLFQDAVTGLLTQSFSKLGRVKIQLKRACSSLEDSLEEGESRSEQAATRKGERDALEAKICLMENKCPEFITAALINH